MSLFSRPRVAAGMSPLGCACVLAALVAGPAAARQAADPSRDRQPATGTNTIVPGSRFGPILETTTRKQLDSIFGAGRVKDADVSIGEDICTPGTEIMSGTPDALDLAWQDATRTRVAFVRTRSAGTRWTTARGVRVGTSLRELERLAGRVLTFLGFGWDYGGGLNWTEGGGDLGLRLDIDPRDQETAGAAGNESIFGDKLVRSDDPRVRSLRISVEEITHVWGRHFEEVGCG